MNVLEIKLAVRSRDGFCCTQCGMTQAEHFAIYRRDLHVHRIVPGSEYSVTEGVCITVCYSCHGPLPRRRSRPAPVETAPVRLPIELMRDIRSTSSVLGEAPNDYVARVVREALRKDMPRAAKLLTKRAEQADNEDADGGK